MGLRDSELRRRFACLESRGTCQCSNILPVAVTFVCLGSGSFLRRRPAHPHPAHTNVALLGSNMETEIHAAQWPSTRRGSLQ